MSVNVFISHSTSTIPEHAAFCRAIHDCLTDAKFNVFLDEKNVEIGAHWRDVIFGSLAECNAAVLLVNEKAMSASDWVDTEARILCWRAWVERKHFRVVIIPFGGVTREQIAEHKPWKPLALAEVEMIPAAGTLDIDDPDAVKDVVADVIKLLTPGHEGGRAGEAWIVNTLCSFLPAKLADLKRVAVDLAIPTDCSESALRKAVAKWMYDTGPAALRILLDLLVRPIPTRDREFLLELLSTHWIDPRASTSILRYCMREATGQIFAINAAKQWFTPRAYVQQLRRSSVVWPVIPIDKKRSRSEILGDIRSDLRNAYIKPLRKLMRKPERAKADVLDPMLNELLEEDAKRDDFVFVALPPEAAHDAKLIAAIHETWKWLRVIVCTGTVGGKNPLPAVPMIEPELDIHLEEEESKSYLAAAKLT